MSPVDKNTCSTSGCNLSVTDKSFSCACCKQKFCFGCTTTIQQLSVIAPSSLISSQSYSPPIHNMLGNHLGRQVCVSCVNDLNESAIKTEYYFFQELLPSDAQIFNEDILEIYRAFIETTLGEHGGINDIVYIVRQYMRDYAISIGFPQIESTEDDYEYDNQYSDGESEYDFYTIYDDIFNERPFSPKSITDV